VIDARIITFEQLAPNCKHRMGSCGLKMGQPNWIPCSKENCPVFEMLPDAKPIIEAATRYLQDNESGARNERISKLSATLEKAEVKP